MGSYHSRAYRKHFEGYTERRDPVSGKIERVYTAKYYKSGLSDRALTGRKRLYAAMLVPAAALWAAVSLSGLPGTMTRPVSLLIALTMIPLFLTAVSVLCFCTAPRNMTICQYNDASVRMKWSALAAGVLLALAGIFELAAALLAEGTHLLQELPGAGGFFAAAAIMFTLFGLERGTDYLLTPNENSSLSDQDGATEIQY